MTVPYVLGGADCSEYVTDVLGIETDENTVSLVTEGWIYEIPIPSLRPGDMVGLCGPGTDGRYGHIQFFDGWLNTDPNDNHYWCWEQAPAIGPRRSLVDWPIGVYKAYRFRDVVEDNVDAPDNRVYVVKRGDTLSAIAATYGTSVAEIGTLNDIPNVNLIYPGQRIVLPDGAGLERFHDVVRGDTLWAISRTYRTTVDELVRLNSIPNRGLIYPGQRLRVR